MASFYPPGESRTLRQKDSEAELHTGNFDIISLKLKQQYQAL
jgi:hypothetical protein